MEKHTENTSNYRCPRCGSHSGQSVALAHAQSVRVGHSGLETISRFGESIAPPPERDEKLVPGVVACFAAGISLFKSPDLLHATGLPFFANLSPFSWKVALVSCVFGWTVGLLIAIPRVRYNVHELPALLRDWESQMLCRRCGET